MRRSTAWGKYFYSQNSIHIWVLPYSCMLKSVKRQGCVSVDCWGHQVALQPSIVPQGSQASAAMGGERKGPTETCGRAPSAQRSSRKSVQCKNGEWSMTLLLAINIFCSLSIFTSFGVLRRILSCVHFLAWSWHGHTLLQRQMNWPRSHLS